MKQEEIKLRQTKEEDESERRRKKEERRRNKKKEGSNENVRWDTLSLSVFRRRRRKRDKAIK